MRRHDQARRHSARKSTPGEAGQASAKGEAKHARLKGSGCVCSCRRLQPASPSGLPFLLLLLLPPKLIVLVERNVPPPIWETAARREGRRLSCRPVDQLAEATDRLIGRQTHPDMQAD